ncbi:MAG: hypothetical protein CVV64_04770 [Candidatus Wallbacteria bacterium HGW-Wallbacteria-1]|jgi:ribosomal peptide maturation radical SAM protein 1|uniref:Uncharacterized protein n=1 Tax=Candidatus Wallbacteria bacterium HGW-Wallbacteria-1 TaxID=2013854 RepID=A0A2N1PRX4_9BACT|nr:MAG: hypothetical protein CVV64_04770 [Candidatus Wallbacteria bacterium HGW-Wallbacteria-1]
MIHLINMPYASLMHPSMGLGQIKALLLRDGIACRTHNLNFLFARMIGVVNFELMALQRGIDTQVGEWFFAREAWGMDFGPDVDEYMEQCAVTPIGLYQKADVREWLLKVRDEIVPDFLDRAVDVILNAFSGECDGRDNVTNDGAGNGTEGEAGQSGTTGNSVDVVGFSCTYFQTIASIALLRRLRARCPELKIVCGGACFHDEMGLELLRSVPEIDAVSLGEADDVIVPLFRAVSLGEAPEGLQGIAYRGVDGVIHYASPEPVSQETLEANPDPDYDEFFKDLVELGIHDDPGARFRVFLPFEASRGCWKGQRMHCTFCGLNNRGLRFRRKSAEKVRKNLENFRSRYPDVNKFHATDCVLPREYFDDFLPDLRDNPLASGTEIFAEVRSTLSRDQMKLLAEAGVIYLQPGIESLSTHLLQCMNKGVTAIKNVHFLKLCRTYGIYPLWNIMIRVPGEKSEDYAESAALIPKIVHFTPPFGGARVVEMQRFSPYFSNPGKWADEITPRPWYKALYPEKQVDLSRVAYFFDARWKDVLDESDYRRLEGSTEAWINVWRFSAELPRLDYAVTPDGGLRITDTRNQMRSGVWELDSREAAIMAATDDPITRKGLKKKLGHLEITDEEIEKALRSFLDFNLVIHEKGQYVNLLLPQGVPNPGALFRRSEARLDLNTRFSLI